MPEPWESIGEAVARATGMAFEVERHRPAGGGSINQAAVIEGAGQTYFVKLNRASRLSMFEAEAEGLAEIAATGTIRVPNPTCHGAAGNEAFLVLEYLELESATDRQASRLGEQLARMHQHTGERFGWHRDNTLGTTPQPNEWTSDWVRFLREQRLEHQLRLLGDPGMSELAEPVLERLPEFFVRYTPRPSLIHGDLWGGNWSGCKGGEPVIFDPAVHYGDREMEIAMTELFGGFPESFRLAYRDAWPLDEGYGRRKPLYLLYHVLNHANLFGGGYVSQARRILEGLRDGGRGGPRG